MIKENLGSGEQRAKFLRERGAGDPAFRFSRKLCRNITMWATTWGFQNVHDSLSFLELKCPKPPKGVNAKASGKAKYIGALITYECKKVGNHHLHYRAKHEFYL